MHLPGRASMGRAERASRESQETGQAGKREEGICVGSHRPCKELKLLVGVEWKDLEQRMPVSWTRMLSGGEKGLDSGYSFSVGVVRFPYMLDVGYKKKKKCQG